MSLQPWKAYHYLRRDGVVIKIPIDEPFQDDDIPVIPLEDLYVRLQNQYDPTRGPVVRSLLPLISNLGLSLVHALKHKESSSSSASTSLPYYYPKGTTTCYVRPDHKPLTADQTRKLDELFCSNLLAPLLQQTMQSTTAFRQEQLDVSRNVLDYNKTKREDAALWHDGTWASRYATTYFDHYDSAMIPKPYPAEDEAFLAAILPRAQSRLLRIYPSDKIATFLAAQHKKADCFGLSGNIAAADMLCIQVYTLRRLFAGAILVPPPFRDPGLLAGDLRLKAIKDPDSAFGPIGTWDVGMANLTPDQKAAWGRFGRMMQFTTWRGDGEPDQLWVVFAGSGMDLFARIKAQERAAGK